MCSNVAKEALALLEARDLARWPKSHYSKLRRSLQQRDIAFGLFFSSKSDYHHLMPKKKSSLLGQNAPMVPTILDDLTTIIGAHRSIEGLFRIEARKSEVDLLELSISHRNQTQSSIMLEGIDIRLACSFLKRWLRQLPEAVIPKNLQRLCVALGERFGRTCDDLETNFPSDAATAVQLVSLLIPPASLAILSHLSKFLAQIIDEASNMMDAEALSRLFGPCIFGTQRSSSSLHPFRVETALKNYVKLVLEYHHLLGTYPDGLQDAVATPEKKLQSTTSNRTEAGSLYSLRKLRIPKRITVRRSKSMHDRSQNRGQFPVPMKKAKIPNNGVFLESAIGEIPKARRTIASTDVLLEEPDNLEWKTLYSARNQRNIR